MKSTIVRSTKLGIIASLAAGMVYGQQVINQILGVPSPEARLLHAAACDNLTAVRYALEDGATVNAQDELGRTALITAAFEGHADLVRLLLDMGASVNATDDCGGSALIYAAMADRVEVVALLLQHGARADAASYVSGQTASDVARNSGAARAGRMLLAHEAAMTARDGIRSGL